MAYEQNYSSTKNSAYAFGSAQGNGYSKGECPTCGYMGKCSRYGHCDLHDSHLGKYGGSSSENLGASIPTLSGAYID